MSNTQVGTIFSQIISDVVESSRVDFEEGGVDEHVLDELRQGWQQKLSTLQIATFPWDPKPEPLQNLAAPPPVPSNVGNTYQPMNAPPQQPSMNAQQMPPQYMNSQPMNHGGPRIKSEPGLDSPTDPGHQQLYPNPILPPGNNPPSAAQRAAMNLQNNYGQRAAASINAIQSSVGGQQHSQMPGQPQQMNMQPMQQQQGMHGQQMAHMQQQRTANGQPAAMPRMTQEQYKAMMVQQQRQQSQNAGVHNAQTDGPGDLEESKSLIKRVNADGEEVMGRIEIDALIRDKIEAMGQRMEGGGLMLPLHQATSSKKRQRKVKKSTTLPSQFDGPDSDDDKTDVKDELDEDAINSDLDDPEDNSDNGDDEDESMGHVMLCMYDKVQRVKNKWKCVMKDGVLSVNGKEYVFHKASGEYEW